MCGDGLDDIDDTDDNKGGSESEGNWFNDFNLFDDGGKDNFDVFLASGAVSSEERMTYQMNATVQRCKTILPFRHLLSLCLQFFTTQPKTNETHN